MDYLENLFGLRGKCAVVIGGTGELCGAMAEGLAGAGAYVYLVGRNKDKAESRLEEIYYHRLKPSSGYVHQRVYTDDRSLDETLSAEDRDVVLVPEGYHPVGVPHGYTCYYLNVMAGPVREWHFDNDPDLE